MINKELLGILCCPLCKSDLELVEENKILICSKCNEKYEVVNDIPIMLPGEYEKKKNSIASK
ncbi:MAG: Trm112 family protein [Bacteroidetes bacterium]|nr:Trm112 family protein [Bacteroidota bacterium]